MRNNLMPTELADLEQRLGARPGLEPSSALRDGVMRAVEAELNRPPHGQASGWNWAAVAVTMLLVLNLSAVWGVKDRYSVWGSNLAGWALAQHGWLKEPRTK